MVQPRSVGAEGAVSAAAVPFQQPATMEQARLFRLTKYVPMSVNDVAQQVRREIEELKTRMPSDDVGCPLCTSLYEGVDFNDQQSVNAAFQRQ